jgi:anti-anti-sigma factor
LTTPSRGGSSGGFDLPGRPCGEAAQHEQRDPQVGRALGAGSATAAELASPEPFAVKVRRGDDVAIVQPRGELDLASVATLRIALDCIASAERLVLDLRGLTFLDCPGLHVLVALHQRARLGGSQLTLLAPAAPADRAIQLCGLDRVLPFVAADDALRGEPGGQTSRAGGDRCPMRRGARSIEALAGSGTGAQVPTRRRAC